MIKVGILGYGNLGCGVEAAVTLSDDMELVAIYTRRDPKSVTVKTDTLVKSTNSLTVAISCLKLASCAFVITPIISYSCI